MMSIQGSRSTLIFPILEPEEQADSLDSLFQLANTNDAKIQFIYRVSYLSYFNPRSYAREACIANCLGSSSAPSWIAEVYQRDHLETRIRQIEGWIQEASHLGISAQLLTVNESSTDFRERLMNLARDAGSTTSLVADEYLMGKFLRRRLFKKTKVKLTLISRKTDVTFPELSSDWAAA